MYNQPQLYNQIEGSTSSSEQTAVVLNGNMPEIQANYNQQIVNPNEIKQPFPI